MVAAIENALERVPALEDGLFGLVRQRNPPLDFVRIEQDVLRGDVYVVNQFLIHDRSGGLPEAAKYFIER